MHAPALAIAWQYWRRHRWELVGSGAVLLAMALAYPVLFTATRDPSAVLASLLPAVVVFGRLLNTLLFVDEVGSLSAGYPRRMFALPVRTRTLVTWPMLYGAAGVALLWLVTAGLVYRRSGFETPLLLPALGLAATLAWLQAITWAPLGNEWVRVALTAVLLAALGGLPLWLDVTERADEVALAALLAGYVAAAYGVALAGVARARHGDSWRLRLALPQLRTWRAARPFRSPASAQFWYEWRCHGLFLPIFTGGFLLTSHVVILLFVEGAASHGGGGGLGLSLGVPLILAGALGANLARVGPGWAPERGALFFVGTRPMTSGSLVAAKFRMVAWSVLLTWAVVGGLTLLRAATGQSTGLAEPWRALTRLPLWKAAVILAAGSVALLLLTWRLATDSFPAFLTGRRWVAALISVITPVLLLGGTGGWLWLQGHPEDAARVVAAVPWLIASAAVFKTVVAAWAFRAAVRRGLICTRSLRVLMAAWGVLVACTAGLVALLAPAEGLPVSWPIVLLGIATFTPLARFALAPLALDWNRHR